MSQKDSKDGFLSAIEIAGITFVLTTRDTHITLLTPDSFHKAFIKKKNDSDNQNADIKIHVELADFDPEKLTMIFDGGPSWSMYAEESNYIITRHSPDFKKPLWSARINREFSEANVYCSSQMGQNENGKTTLLNPFRYPLDQILLMHILAGKKGALVHAAGVAINGRGLIFPGASGAGKTTLSHQFLKRKNFKFLSDDRVVIRKIGKGFMLFGTPWPGEAGIAEAVDAPLSGIYFITHGDVNRINEIKPNNALKRLLPVLSIPLYDKQMTASILTFCEELIFHIPAYELCFKPGKGTADILEKHVSIQKRI